MESGNSNPVRFRFHSAVSNLMRGPVLALLEYSGVLRTQAISDSGHETEQPIIAEPIVDYDGSDVQTSRVEEVSIMIMIGEELDHLSGLAVDVGGVGSGTDGGSSSPSTPGDGSSSDSSPREPGTGAGGNDVSEEPSSHRFDIHQVAQWVE